jgi:hypothetical protein
MELPEPQHIKRLLALGQDLMQEHSGDGHLLIHCHAGFSRSPGGTGRHPGAGIANAFSRGDYRRGPADPAKLGRICGSSSSATKRSIGWVAIIDAAATIYRRRLQQQPGLAELIIANGRAREVEVGRRRKCRLRHLTRLSCTSCARFGAIAGAVRRAGPDGLRSRSLRHRQPAATSGFHRSAVPPLSWTLARASKQTACRVPSSKRRGNRAAHHRRGTVAPPSGQRPAAKARSHRCSANAETFFRPPQGSSEA